MYGMLSAIGQVYDRLRNRSLFVLSSGALRREALSMLTLIKADPIGALAFLAMAWLALWPE